MLRFTHWMERVIERCFDYVVLWPAGMILAFTWIPLWSPVYAYYLFFTKKD